MKKKIGCILIMALCLTGCANGTKNNKGNNNADNVNQESDAMGTENNETTNTENTVANNNTQTQDSYVIEHAKITDGNEALERLKEGNRRFLNDESILLNVTEERRDILEEGQSPYAVIVSCSDSRVTPTTIFNSGLGEIFDIRLAGNILNKEALGSVEYGVEHLHAPLLVIMGYESCGAVTAAYDKMTEGAEVEGNINSIVEQIEPAITKADDLDEAIHMNIDYVTEQVMQDEIVRHLVENGQLVVVKAYYSLEGVVTFANVEESIDS